MSIPFLSAKTNAITMMTVPGLKMVVSTATTKANARRQSPTHNAEIRATPTGIVLGLRRGARDAKMENVAADVESRLASMQ